MIYIGIDNGVTGSIGIINDKCEAKRFLVPVNSELSYTKTKQYITRIDHKALLALLSNEISNDCCLTCYIERPMINPMRFKASMSAMRSLESTQIILETLKIPYTFVDSKEWQKVLLPSGCKKEELKSAGVMICKRLFPNIVIEKGGDADGLLIAEHARRLNTRCNT